MNAAISGLRSPLYVESQGDGPVLVMLHGGGGGVDDLAALRERLQAGRRVISPEQRGHGRSTGEGEISYAVQAADTCALLDELGVHAADIVGWSDGGVLGLLIARDRPDLVGRLVTVSANAALNSVPPALTDGAKNYLANAKPGDLDMPDSRKALAGAEADWPTTAARILQMWRDGPDLEIADLGRLTASVLYMAADRDIVPGEHTLAMFGATPDAQLAIVPDATHRLVQTHVEAVAAITQGFLRA